LEGALPHQSPFNASRLKVRQLMLVLSLKDTQNLNKAAEVLGMSQPAATRLLKEIEDTLDAPLFERTPKGMVPTLYGDATARYAKALLSDMNKLHKELEGLKRGIEGEVRIGAVTASVPGLMVDMIRAVLADYPNVAFTLVTEGSSTLLPALLDRRLDLVVGRVVGTYSEEQLGFEPLLEEELSIVVGRHNKLLRRSRLSLSDLAGENWILEPHPSPSRTTVEAAFERAGLGHPSCIVQSVSIVGLTNLVHNTNLLGVLPTSVARYFTELSAIAILPVVLPKGQRLGLVTVPNRPLSPAAEHVVTTLRRLALGQLFENGENSIPIFDS
jgi:DNA-binding transcriptional LysR family regulator